MTIASDHRVSRAVADRLGALYKTSTTYNQSSPLEVRFAGAFLVVCERRGATADIQIQREVSISPYLVDFLITGLRPLAIECDGHTYHDGGGQSAAIRDRRRDRYILRTAGIPTMRFLGREIRENPMACAGEALEYVLGDVA